MKALNLLKSVTLLATFVSLCSAVNAQFQSNVSSVPRNKINVQLNITPSVPGFHAGISVVDSLNNKVRVWVANREENKFTISIGHDAGTLWDQTLRDAYYSRVFDLSSLEDGAYVFRIVCGGQLIERRLVIATNTYVQRDLRIE